MHVRTRSSSSDGGSVPDLIHEFESIVLGIAAETNGSKKDQANLPHLFQILWKSKRI